MAGETWFVYFKGRQIRAAFEEMLLCGAIEEANAFSARITHALSALREEIARQGGTVLIYAGATVLFTGNGSCEELRACGWQAEQCARFQTLTGQAASFGAGATPYEAYCRCKAAQTQACEEQEEHLTHRGAMP